MAMPKRSYTACPGHGYDGPEIVVEHFGDRAPVNADTLENPHDMFGDCVICSDPIIALNLWPCKHGTCDGCHAKLAAAAPAGGDLRCVVCRAPAPLDKISKYPMPKEVQGQLQKLLDCINLADSLAPAQFPDKRQSSATPDAKIGFSTTPEGKSATMIVIQPAVGGNDTTGNVFLIDTSGSMQPAIVEVLEATKQVVNAAAAKKSYIAVVTFNGSPNTVVHPTRVSSENVLEIMASLGAIKAMGGTYLGSGLAHTRTVAAEMRELIFKETGSANEVIAVKVVTDGDSAPDHSDRKAVADALNAMNGELQVIGFGKDFNFRNFANIGIGIEKRGTQSAANFDHAEDAGKLERLLLQQTQFGNMAIKCSETAQIYCNGTVVSPANGYFTWNFSVDTGLRFAVVDTHSPDLDAFKINGRPATVEHCGLTGFETRNFVGGTGAIELVMELIGKFQVHDRGGLEMYKNILSYVRKAVIKFGESMNEVVRIIDEQLARTTQSMQDLHMGQNGAARAGSKVIGRLSSAAQEPMRYPTAPPASLP
jgi:uncharacterized protein YegL